MWFCVITPVSMSPTSTLAPDISLDHQNRKSHIAFPTCQSITLNIYMYIYIIYVCILYTYIYICIFMYHCNNCNRKVKHHPSQTSKSLRMRPSISTSCPGCMCSTRLLELGQPNPSVDEGLQLWSRQARVTWLKGSKVLSSFI